MTEETKDLCWAITASAAWFAFVMVLCYFFAFYAQYELTHP